MDQMIVRPISPDDLEPDLVALATPILRKWEAAALRVAANRSDPNEFQLPADADTPESILAQRFERIANVRPDIADRAGASAVARINVAKTQRRLGETLALDFRQPTSVDALAKPALQPPSKEAVLRLVDRHYSALRLQRTTSAALSPLREVRLDLVRVVCVDETNGLFGTEAGNDEIYMSGLTLDESANADKIAPFEVSDSFDDGDRKDYIPPKRLVTFDVGGGTSYPKHYFATLLLLETDGGDVDETIEKIFWKFVEEVKKKVAAWLTGAVVGGAIGGALGGIIGALVGYIVGYLLDRLVEFLISLWQDVIFHPRTLEFLIPSATAILTEPSKVFHFYGPGEYAVRYRWSVA
jgi:hypothetical protein